MFRLIFVTLLGVLWCMAAYGSAPAGANPLPPCVDSQYSVDTAGSVCQVDGDTTPTARCNDGTFDYSRSISACNGHGGVFMYIGPPYTGQAPGFGTVTASSTVSFLQVSGTAPNHVASATVQGPPGAVCMLAYVTPHGTPSTADGLQGSQQLGLNGTATWTWLIDSNTYLGTGTLTATCTPGGTATAPIQIG